MNVFPEMGGRLLLALGLAAVGFVLVLVLDLIDLIGVEAEMLLL